MIRMQSAASAAQQFRDRCVGPLGRPHEEALASLVESCRSDPVVVINAFRRFRITDAPPDGGRNASEPVVAAVTPYGIRWAGLPATRGFLKKTVIPPAIGVDRYAEFAQVTFGAAEVLLETDATQASGVGFTNEDTIARDPGEYLAALEFVVAVAVLGYQGAAGSGPIRPTAEEIEGIRADLGLT